MDDGRDQSPQYRSSKCLLVQVTFHVAVDMTVEVAVVSCYYR